MAKHAKKSDELQLLDSPKTTIVEVSFELLEALGNIEHSFFELCIGTSSKSWLL